MLCYDFKFRCRENVNLFIPLYTYWVDTADSQPCIGTGGFIPWIFTVTAKLFHSGLPNKAINALELGMEALKVIQTNFYKDYPPHPQEDVYCLTCPMVTWSLQTSLHSWKNDMRFVYITIQRLVCRIRFLV